MDRAGAALQARLLESGTFLVDPGRARTQPLLVCEPGLRPWARVRSPEPLVVAWPLGARVLVVEAERATLDGVEVLGREATGLLPVLRFLADRWREDVADGKVPGDHCTWSLEDIRAGLRDTDPSSAPGLATLRRQVSRLRAGIARRHLEVLAGKHGRLGSLQKEPGRIRLNRGPQLRGRQPGSAQNPPSTVERGCPAARAGCPVAAGHGGAP